MRVVKGFYTLANVFIILPTSWTSIKESNMELNYKLSRYNQHT